MIENLAFVLTFATALGCGLVAGIFFAFSAFVMKALLRLPPAQGMATMQAVNVAVHRLHNRRRIHAERASRSPL
jgi:uncharacterized membrane protein